MVQIHAKKILLSEDVDLEIVARGTTGFSGRFISIVITGAVS